MSIPVWHPVLTVLVWCVCGVLMQYEFETRYTIRGRHGEPDDPIHEVRDPGEIDGQPFDVSDCNNCVVVLLDHTDQIQIQNVHNSR